MKEKVTLPVSNIGPESQWLKAKTVAMKVEVLRLLEMLTPDKLAYAGLTVLLAPPGSKASVYHVPGTFKLGRIPIVSSHYRQMTAALGDRWRYASDSTSGALTEDTTVNSILNTLSWIDAALCAKFVLRSEDVLTMLLAVPDGRNRLLVTGNVGAAYGMYLMGAKIALYYPDLRMHKVWMTEKGNAGEQPHYKVVGWPLIVNEDKLEELRSSYFYFARAMRSVATVTEASLPQYLRSGLPAYQQLMIERRQRIAALNDAAV